MKSHRFPISAGLLTALAFAAVASFAIDAGAAGAKPHASSKAAKAEPAKPAGEVVSYEALENRVGEELVVETTFHTTRRGKLVKYTQPTLTLDMGTAANPVELTVPRETIKTIMVVAPAAEPANDAGTSGAKKN